MTKKNFKPFRISDLTGGINNRDYASEIEDKQVVNLENFNFKGNRLISSKGIDRVHNSLFDITIQGLTVDGDDLWHIEGGSLYKNGGLLFPANDYVLTVGNIDGEIFSMNIEGSDYTFKFGFNSNEELARTQFETELISILPALTYNVSYSGSGIYSINRIDGGVMSFSNPNLVKYIKLNDWNEHTKIDINIDGTITSIDGTTYPDANDALDYVVTQLPGATYLTTTASSSQIEIAKINAGVSIISSTEYDRYSYAITAENRAWSYWYSSGDINKEYQCYVEVDGVNHRYTLDSGLTFDPLPADIPYTNLTFTYSDGGENDNNRTIHGAKRFDMLYDLLGVGYSKSSISQTEKIVPNPFSGTVSSDLFAFSFNKDDYTQSTILSYSITVNEDLILDTDYGWFSQTETINTATITTGTYSEVSHIITDDTGLGLISDDLYDITISSYGILIVSKRGFSPVFINNAGVSSEIDTSAVGTPTVGTIYNGKIILGGYEGKDTIVFSQTDDPVAVGDEILDFALYSAGAQSVSGGNKGMITGMSIGENGLYVFKENEVWYTNSEKDTGTSFNFIFNKISSNGAVNQGSVSEVGQETFYFDYKNKKVRRLGYEQNLTTLRDVAISREVEEIFDAIPDNPYNNGTIISTSFIYPNFDIHIPTATSEIFELVASNDWRYQIPNKTVTYNVENKSWTTRNDKDNIGVLHSFKGYIGTKDGDIYKDHIGNTEGDSLLESKQYTFGDDVMYKKFGRFDLVGKIVPEEENVLTIEIWIGDEKVDERIYTYSTETLIKEKIDLYDIGQSFEFKIRKTGKGELEIHDVNIYSKPTSIQPQDYN